MSRLVILEPAKTNYSVKKSRSVHERLGKINAAI